MFDSLTGRFDAVFKKLRARGKPHAKQVVKVVGEELQETLGGEHRAFHLPSAKPAVVMMAGVQGSGKTTACAKLALHLKKRGKRVLLVAADLQRPAAVEQLFTLGRAIGGAARSE